MNPTPELSRELRNKILLGDDQWATFVRQQPDQLNELLRNGDAEARQIAASRVWNLPRGKRWKLPEGVRPGTLARVVSILRTKQS